MEYDTFLPLLSYFLPVPELRNNNNFKKWMRDTPNLSDQFADTLLFTLPAPRTQFY